MGSVLTRTTSSPLFQARDCGVGLADADGRVLCQAEYMPLMSYAWVYQLKALTNFFGDDIRPGDVFTSSDVFYGGNQAQDVAVFAPVFVDEKLCFWSVAKGHVLDIGGPVLSGYNPDATEVWQETIRITPLKLYDRGVLRRDVWTLLLENTRVPEIVGRDWQAMIGACEIGRRRLLELVERYGEDELVSLVDALLDSTEQRMRAEIDQLADGAYHGEASWRWVSTSADETYTARAEITISDSDVRVDFSDSDAQARWYLNGAYSTTFASAVATLFMLVDPDIPHNEGALRCFSLTVPSGTFLNAAFPAPTVLGNFVCNDVVPEAMMRALAGVTPRVTAGWCRPYCHVVVGVDPRSGAFNVTEPLIQNKGGAGATRGFDGYSTIGILTGGGAYLFEDYESFEIQNPVFLIRHEYETDSAGAGEFRGGLGLRLEYQTDARDASVVTFGDGHTVPYGLAGGLDAPSSSIIVQDGERMISPVANGLLAVNPGARIALVATGGGGYGDARRRPFDLVTADVQNGVVSAEAAARDYGVVFRDDSRRLDVDLTRSAAR
jgi:N-methylhydantoinase B